jgi:adenylate cyclase class IV
LFERKHFDYWAACADPLVTWGAALKQKMVQTQTAQQQGTETVDLGFVAAVVLQKRRKHFDYWAACADPLVTWGVALKQKMVQTQTAQQQGTETVDLGFVAAVVLQKRRKHFDYW